MTLLLVEARRAEQAFADRWMAGPGHEFQTRHPVPDALFDHYPFLLYEYFATVTMGAARRVALAAYAGSMTHRLRYLGSRGRYEAERVDRACEWLQAYAIEQLKPDLSHFPELVAAGHRRLRDAFLCDYGTTGAEHLWRTVSDATALAHATTEAFATLAGQAVLTGPLVESQTHLHAGLTLYQNCVTWKEDFVRGHPSHVVPVLISDMGARPATTSEAARYFYYGGLAEHTLGVAVGHLCRAMAVVTDLPPGLWVQHLAGVLQTVQDLRADIRRIRHSQLASLRGPVIQHDAHGRMSARGAEAAVQFVRGEQAPAGFWGDFLLLGQQSTSWVTGYVGWHLAVTGTAAVNLDAPADWLTEHQLPGGGWGYNSHWPVDIDSTANGLLFLTTLRPADRDRWMPLLTWLLSKQQPDGGFATITDPDPWLLRFGSETADLAGWTSSHPCVTAVVALLLAGFDGTRERDGAARAVSYLLEHQNPEGYWDAYWWIGRLYTTCRAVQAIGRVDLPCLTRAAAWLLRSQRSDGGWANLPTQRPAAFPTALAVQALCNIRDALPIDTEAAIARGTRWLLSHQLPDGSWPTRPILRVPRPDLRHPWEQASWIESINGLDVAVPDWRRLFTTATALRALHAAGTTHPLSTGGP